MNAIRPNGFFTADPEMPWNKARPIAVTVEWFEQLEAYLEPSERIGIASREEFGLALVSPGTRGWLFFYVPDEEEVKA